jgi:hypothetical protein
MTLASMSIGSEAHAQQDSALDLKWVAPAECPDEHAVRASVDQHLAQTGTRSLRERVSALVLVQTADGRWTARLRLRGAVSGERNFEADSCEELSEIVSLVVALALQSTPVTPQRQRPTVPSPAPHPKAERPPAQAEPEKLDRPPRHAAASSRAHFALGISGVADSAVLSRWAFGIAAMGLLEWRSIQTSLGAAYFPPVDRALPAHAEARATFDLVILRLQGCYSFSVEPLSLGPCLAAEGGVLRGRAEGIQQPEQTSIGWLAAETGGAAGLPAGPCVLRVEAGALWPLRRPRFVTDEQNEAHQVAALGWRALFAVLVPL